MKILFTYFNKNAVINLPVKNGPVLSFILFLLIKIIFRYTLVKIEDTEVLQIEKQPAKRKGRPPKKVWPCKYCCAVFKNKRDFYTHNSSAHHHRTSDNKATHTCKLCYMEFLSKTDLEEHFEMHEETKFTCAACGQVFNTGYKYSLHLYEHNNSSGYPCPFCDFTTPKQKSIANHINAAHFQRLKHVCRYCGKRFSNAVYRMEHEEGHIGGSAEFQCVVCNREFSENHKLTMHQIYYHKVPVKLKRTKTCEICNKTYANQQLLEIHLRNFHGKATTNKADKYTLCSICGKYVIRLDRHMRIHTDYKPYKCSNCEKCFNRSADLMVHERVHTGERPYVCKICGKRFRQMSGFSGHVRLHGGEKPYKCHWCDGEFISKQRLICHLKSCTQ